MNSSRKVFLFVVYSVVIYLLISVGGTIFHFSPMPFKRVNLISDIIIHDSTDFSTDTSSGNTIVIENKPKEDFNLYHTSHFITSFSTDTAKPSLERFVRKLHDLKTGKKKKIRIAYFGDSMIEGDLLTQTLRKLLQQTFGGNGVGFVPITSQVSKFRITAIDNYSGGWQDENFKTTDDARHLFLSGHLFRSGGDWVQMADQTIHDSTAIIEKSLLCGYTATPVNITVNNTAFVPNAAAPFNRIVMVKDQNHGIKLSVADERLPVYGITFESESGIFVDNFSFRGITGIEFAKIDSAFLSSVAANNPYDLIIFQYGVNLLFRPNDKNFSWYARALLPVVRKFKNCFRESDFLLVSTADRAFRYGGEYRSAIGIDSLVKVQALLAFESGCSFYNQFETMGGTNSIVDWANRSPSLANRDYVHPNHRGAEVLGGYFFEAIMNEYQKYTRTLK
jgi:hypothetical protein